MAKKELTESKKALLQQNEALLRDMKHLQQDRSEKFHAPSFTLRTITENFGVPEVTVRNWLTRGQLDIQAQEGRAKGKWRLFSIRDAVIIATAFHLSRMGIPVALLDEASQRVAALAEGMLTRIMGVSGKPVIVIWNDGEWHVKSSFDSGHLTDAAPATAFTVLNAEALVIDALDKLGMSVRRHDAGER